MISSCFLEQWVPNPITTQILQGTVMVIRDVLKTQDC